MRLNGKDQVDRLPTVKTSEVGSIFSAVKRNKFVTAFPNFQLSFNLNQNSTNGHRYLIRTRSRGCFYIRMSVAHFLILEFAKDS